MASDAASMNCQNTTEGHFSNSCNEIPQSNYHQHQYLNSSSCDRHHDSVRFIQLDHQQQQQHYESHQEHKNFIQNSCNCYQNGGNQVCSRCQTNEEQNNAGVFIYQTIQPDDVLSRSSGSSQVQNQAASNHQSAGYSSTSSSPSSSLSSSSVDNKHNNNPFQEPVYESSIKYYLKQPQQSEHQSYNNDNINNNASVCSSERNHNLISASLRCQTTCSFNNNNSNNNNNNIIIENNDTGSAGLFYQCSSNSNNELAQYADCLNTTDDWKARSLVGVPSSAGQEKLFVGCNIDSNNNNSAQPPISQEEVQQFSSARYSMIAQDIKKSPCQPEAYQQFDNNDDNNFTSIHHYDNYNQQASHLCEPVSSFVTPYESTSTNQQHQQQQMIQLGIAVNYNEQQQSQTLSIQTDGSLGANLDLPAQSCFASSTPACQHQPAIVDQSTSGKSKARRKNPTALTKVNGKLWEFIRDLLLSDRTNPAFIRWERREDGVFKFVQSNKVAKMWGERKQNPKMTYEKLSRAMRYYYKSKVLLPVFGRRLVYKFGPNASGWNKAG